MGFEPTTLPALFRILEPLMLQPLIHMKRPRATDSVTSTDEDYADELRLL